MARKEEIAWLTDTQTHTAERSTDKNCRKKKEKWLPRDQELWMIKYL